MIKLPVKEERNRIFIQKYKELLDKRGDLNQNSVCLSIGTTYNYVYKILKGESPVSESIFKAFVETYLDSEYNLKVSNSNLKKLESSKIVASKNESTVSGQNDDNLFKKIPYFELNVSAGGTQYLDNVLFENELPNSFFYVPNNIDADFALRVYGDSMYPVISNGDIIAVKLLKDISFFNYGMIYIVITNEQRLVKYLRKHLDPKFVSLQSANDLYDPIDLPISSIINLLQVRFIGKISM